MEDSEKKMIYIFYNEKPEGTKYVRGICRIYPLDDYMGTYYKDPSPWESDGLFTLLEEEPKIEHKKKEKSSNFIDALRSSLEKLDLKHKKIYKKGSRVGISNDRIVKRWKIHRRLECGRLESDF